MSKKRFVCSGIILVLPIMTISIYLTIQKDGKDLDSWIGEYSYVAVISHNSGLLNYIIEYNINIYKQDKEYYAKITNEGWQTQVRTLASVKGNEKKIDIIFLETLPDDHIYDSERYDAGEVLLQFQRDGTGIITVWKAMKMENPVLSEMDGDVIGKYFCCEPISEGLLAEEESAWVYDYCTEFAKERDSSIQQSAKLVKFTNEDSLYIEYPYLNADDEVSRYINEQIYHIGDIK